MDLNNLAAQAGELLEQHGDKVEGAVDAVADVVKDKYGHAEQVDAAAEKLKEIIPDGPVAHPAPGV